MFLQIRHKQAKTLILALQNLKYLYFIALLPFFIGGHNMLSPDAFYDLSAQHRNELLAFHAKALAPTHQGRGFSGEIVFLDNGEGVYPRLTVAKYPRWQKILTPADRANRFLREINLQASAYYHPNVHWPFKVIFILGVPVAFFRRWEGDLSDFIEDETFGDVGRLSLMIQLAAGVAHCHNRGLVHQDLKPENIFVRDLRASFPGLPEADVWLRPLVADFGSVNLATEIGEFTGSRPYMAPEQWLKTPLGEWTSVFVLGVILHELMSRGIHPIGERSGDWHRQVRPNFNRWQKNDLWRRWLESGCPIAQPLPDSEIADLVAACLSSSPDDRPTLKEVQMALHSILQSHSVTAVAQVDLFLKTAEEDSQAADWPHLISSIEGLKREIEEHYPST